MAGNSLSKETQDKASEKVVCCCYAPIFLFFSFLFSFIWDVGLFVRRIAGFYTGMTIIKKLHCKDKYLSMSMVFQCFNIETNEAGSIIE